MQLYIGVDLYYYWSNELDSQKKTIESVSMWEFVKHNYQTN